MFRSLFDWLFDKTPPRVWPLVTFALLVGPLVGLVVFCVVAGLREAEPVAMVLWLNPFMWLGALVFGLPAALVSLLVIAVLRGLSFQLAPDMVGVIGAVCTTLWMPVIVGSADVPGLTVVGYALIGFLSGALSYRFAQDWTRRRPVSD